MKKNFCLFVFLLVCLMIDACSPGPVVNTENLSNSDLSRFETYAYLPSDDTATYTTFLEQKVIKEVDQQMKARGFELDTAKPDLLVLVKTMLEKEERFRREPIRTNYNYSIPSTQIGTALGPIYYRTLPSVSRMSAFSEAIKEVAYTEGTFVVDVIERNDNKIIWRGWSASPVDETRLNNSIRDYIANIYEEFPVDPVNE